MSAQTDPSSHSTPSEKTLQARRTSVVACYTAVAFAVIVAIVVIALGVTPIVAFAMIPLAGTMLYVASEAKKGAFDEKPEAT